MEKFHKNNRLTDEQRLNMMEMGIGTQHNTTEKEVLKVLRHKKFPDFNKGVTV